MVTHWFGLLDTLSGIVGRKIDEIHTRDFYSGNGVWRDLHGSQRANVITEVFDWIAARKHHLVYTAVDKKTYFANFKAGGIHPELSTPWRFMGYHLLLAIQRAFQGNEKTKGHTILVFDNEEREKLHFTDLVNNPPAWSDSYYSKTKKQDRLDQIIDVPYFGDSVEVALIQVADLVAYFLRRYAEIMDGYTPPRYEHEKAKVATWIATVRDRSIGRSSIYPAKGRCECSDLFFVNAPASIRQL